MTFKIYLAGPDVFFHDRAQIFQRLLAACERVGLQGLPPWENEGNSPLPTGPALAQLIYDDNIRRIREADGVIANLVNFRGQEPDSGTVFEMGFAVALGKPVVGYGVAPGDYAERVAAAMACERDAKGRLIEVGNRCKVEDMGNALNLMLAKSAPLEATAELALVRMTKLLMQ